MRQQIMTAQRLLCTAARPMQQLSTASSAACRIGSSRSFSSLPNLRPSIPAFSAAKPSCVFRPSALQPALHAAFTPASPEAAGVAEAADVVPKSAITAHPALGGGMQIRCGPRNTLQRNSRLIQKRRHGFLSRIRTKTGQKLLKRRIAKGRKKLCT